MEDEIGLSELLDIIIRDKGGSVQDYEKLMEYIAFHETGPAQRMDPKALQERKEKGNVRYGRGLFQFEMGEGKGGNTAANRLANLLDREGVEKPQWLIDIWENKKSVDASKLTAEQQKMLFLGNHREHPDANFSKIWSGEQSVPEFWLNYHWAGSKDEAQEKLDLFNKSVLAKDSVDAIKAREEELMYKQNMAPFLSDTNNINNIPKVSDLFNSIFGNKSSSLLK